eukprot:scaffold15007_cov129-Isochrysis_galbana.AAC.1
MAPVRGPPPRPRQVMRMPEMRFAHLACNSDSQAKKILKKKVVKKFTIDCSQPVDDGIMDAASFVRACLARWRCRVQTRCRCRVQRGGLLRAVEGTDASVFARRGRSLMCLSASF